MSRIEFERWQQFYESAPFDDLHRFHRPAALVAHSMGGADVAKLLEFLRPTPMNRAYSSADLATIAAFGGKPPGK